MTRASTSGKTSKRSAQKKGENKVMKLKNSQKKLKEIFERSNLNLSNSLMRVFEVLDDYTKKHLLDSEPVIFRELLRLVHRFLPKSEQKSKIRGVLGNICLLMIHWLANSCFIINKFRPLHPWRYQHRMAESFPNLGDNCGDFERFDIRKWQVA